MSNSVASESLDYKESREMSRKRGAEDEGNEDWEEIIEIPPAESLLISTVVSTVPATTDQFIRRRFVELVPGDTLVRLRLMTKVWKAAADAFIDEGVKSGMMIVHGGKDEDWFLSNTVKGTRRKLVTRVIFLLNVAKVGHYAIAFTVNLVVVDIPEGVVSIGDFAFGNCTSLTTVSFPTTLKLVDESAFYKYSSLGNVDLLHTNLKESGRWAFADCSELKKMTIPDSLQTLGHHVFHRRSKLVPSNINVDCDSDDGNEDENDYHIDTTPQVVFHLRYVQHQIQLAKKNAEVAALKATVAERDDEVTTLQTENGTLKTDNVTLKATVAECDDEVTALETENATLKTQIDKQH
ncbi:hypothetical protein TL16_g06354 [Triparma laevis f. inornata]|uniref:Uncharacterized protein n=1 Tax=Triparma laevis f. inornata TaxID=1714386 RepID=A0A9W7ECU0_9STRA|nr:hypothetical protein TL16_g06354 [Triparma laevis f. inornata]